jgi:hypothetical protein
MTEKTPREISKSELSANALQTINLASIATDAVTYAMDSSESQNQVNQLLTETSKMLADAQAFLVWCNKDPEKIIKQALQQIPQTMNTVYQWQRTLQLARKSNLSVSAALFQQRINNIMQRDHVNAWSKVLLDTPDAYLVKQANKFWAKAFAIGTPSDRDAYMLMINGFWTSEKYENEMREDLGYSKEDATHLAQIRNWQIGVPSLREAWVMVQRKLWVKADWLKLATLGYGFTTADANALYSLNAYDPSLGDVMSLGSLIPLDNVWVNEKLDRTGMNLVDKTVFLTALSKKVIRDEIRSFWGQILSVAQWGLTTDAELTLMLTNWKFSPAEIAIKLETVDLLKTKLCAQLARDSEIYLYRKGTIVEIDLYNRLIAQSIPEEVANALTRNEACKLGIDWELPPP